MSPFDLAWNLLKSGYRAEGISDEEIREMERARLAQMDDLGIGGPMHSHAEEEAEAPFQQFAPHLDPITGEFAPHLDPITGELQPEEEEEEWKDLTTRVGAGEGRSLGEEYDFQTNNPGVRPSQTDEARSDRLMVAREKRGLQSMKDEPKLQRRIDRRQQLGRN